MPIDLLEKQPSQPVDLFKANGVPEDYDPKDSFGTKLAKSVKTGAKSAYQEGVAPFVHAASLYAGDIPKAIGSRDTSPEGKQAYNALYPEQKTTEGKMLRLGLSVPALVAGSGARFAGTAGKILETIGTQAVKMIPRLAGKSATASVARGVGTVAKLAGEGAAFGAGYAPQQGEDYANQIAGGAATNVVVPGAAAVLSKIPGVAKLASKQVINSWIKPSKSSKVYGQDAGRGVSKFQIIGNDIHDFLKNVGDKANEIGETIKQKIQLHDQQVGKQTTLNLSGVLKPLDAAMDKASSQNNTALMKRIAEAKKALTYKLTRETLANGDESIVVNGRHQLDNITAEQAFEYKKKISELTKFTGINHTDDTIANSALQDVYRSVRNKLNDAIPALKELNQDYGDLLSAKTATQNTIFKEQNRSMFSMAHTGKIAGVGGILFGLSSHNPSIIAESLALLGVNKALETPAARTRLAAGLSKLGDLDKVRMFHMFPDLRKGVASLVGGNDKSFKGDVFTPEVLAEHEALPGGSLKMLPHPKDVPYSPTQHKLMPTPIKTFNENSGPVIQGERPPAPYKPGPQAVTYKKSGKVIDHGKYKSFAAVGLAGTGFTDEHKQSIANVEQSGKLEGNWGHLTNAVIDDLKKTGKLDKKVTLKQVMADPKLYDDVASLYWKRMGEKPFFVPDEVKHIWWRAPAWYKHSGGGVNKVELKWRKMMKDRVKNDNDFKLKQKQSIP